MTLKLRSLSRLALLGAALAAVPACAGSDDECIPGVDVGCPVPAGTGELAGTIAGNRILRPESTYVLKGYVKVASGATLTVLPGTRIVGDTLTPGSSLFILRGAKLVAEGTAQAPIVFTSQRAPGTRKPGDWGGIVIIGSGEINRKIANISTEGPAEAAQNYAGGSDNGDNSGSLRYVRIEFAGYDVTGTGQELNSLSMYAVGRGTKLENVQTLAGLDDSFEWWGGAVDGRYLLSVESGDDHFDWTEGYQGRNQFLIAFQNDFLQPRQGTGTLSTDPRLMEGDGCDPAVSGCTLAADTASTPLSNPVFANFTLLANKTIPPADGNGIVIRRGSAGTFYNGVVGRVKNTALTIRDAYTNRNRVNNRLVIRNLVFVDNTSNYDSEAGSNFGKKSFFTDAGHRELGGAASALFVSLGAGNPDFTPAAGSQLATGGGAVPAEKVAGFGPGAWTNTTYVGAADPAGTNKWWQGWTAFGTN